MHSSYNSKHHCLTPSSLKTEVDSLLPFLFSVLSLQIFLSLLEGQKDFVVIVYSHVVLIAEVSFMSHG